MEALHLPDNIKVHFAGCEDSQAGASLIELGVNYGLFSAFAWVEKMVFGKHTSPIKKLNWMTETEKDLPKMICDNMHHVIQDSGLFTLMFGSKRGKKEESLVNKWYDGLINFTLNHAQPVTCVEVDCQKILGVEKAWEFRERMKRDLPNNRIINVFHLEDGQYGLDRLIEFSDYIAISIPELRLFNLHEYAPILAKYIRKKKPTIDIHLLGCTAISLIKKCHFCTSCDSSTWTSHKRYGYIEDYHVDDILEDKIIDYFGEKIHSSMKERHPKQCNTICLSIEYQKNKYEMAVGNQDYNYEKVK